MKLPALKPEEYEDEDILEEDEAPVRQGKRRSGAETVLILLTMLCAAVLLVMIVLSLPYLLKKEPEATGDPQAMMHSAHAEEESFLKDAPIEEETAPEETIEPTIPPEANPYTRFDFQYSRDNYLICTRQDSYPGVDVSAFQGKIDWQQVADSGIRFAMIRLGFRGYGSKGTLVEDEYAKQNLKGASEAGLYVGAYFFSQATSIQEVQGEIDFMLKTLGDHELNMPIVLDWEVPTSDSRTVGVDRRTLTDCLRYFCDEMTLRGFHPMVYFNWGQAARMIHLNELEDFPFWLALYQDRMTFPYRVEMWQYTCTGRVPGIETEVDIDVYMPDLRAK